MPLPLTISFKKEKIYSTKGYLRDWAIGSFLTSFFMKILFLYDFPLWGSGSATYPVNLIKELLKFNHKIGVVCPEERRFLRSCNMVSNIFEST